MSLKDRSYEPTRPPLFAVFQSGWVVSEGIFDSYQAAKDYAGDTMDVVMYIPAPQGVTRMSFNEQTEQWSVGEQDDVA